MSRFFIFAAFCTLSIALSSGLVTANASDGQETGVKLEELKNQRRYSEAIELVKHRIDTLKNLDGASPPEVGRMLNILADLEFRNGKINRALEIYRDVVHNFSNFWGENREVYHTALEKLILLHTSLNQHDNAEKYVPLMLMEKELEPAPKINFPQQSASLENRPAVASKQPTALRVEIQPRSSAVQPHGADAQQKLSAFTVENSTRGTVSAGRTSPYSAEPNDLPEKISRNDIARPELAQTSKSETAAHIAALKRPDETQVESKDCPKPEVTATVTNGGILSIYIVSACLAEQFYHISYGKYRFRHRLSSAGSDDQRLDLFAGTQKQISVEFDGHVPIVISVPKSAFENTLKVALVWDKAVDLDLHAFEYAAKPGGKGHIWSAANRTFEETNRLVETQKRAHGYISQSSAGDGRETNIEVYTLIRYPGQRFGVVALVLDFNSRGFKALHPFCGSSELASVPFKIYRLQSSGAVEVEAGLIPAMACGQSLEPKERYLSSTISDIDLRQH